MNDKKRYNPISLKTLMDIHFPENAWSVRGLVPLEALTIISGAPSSYKTWFTALMALRIAQGEKFLDTFETQKSNVLVIDEENTLREIQRRVQRLQGDENLPLYYLSQEGFLVRDEMSRQRVLDFCKEEDIRVLFIDSLVRVNDADENVANQMAEFFRNLKVFCKAGITVVLIHHERKMGIGKSSAQNRLRGSSEISAAPDSHISITRDKDDRNIIIVEQSKLRADKELDPFEVEIKDDEETTSFEFLGHKDKYRSKLDIARSLILEILTQNEEGLNRNGLIEAVRQVQAIGEKTVRNALSGLVSESSVLERAGVKSERICYLPPKVVNE